MRKRKVDLMQHAFVVSLVAALVAAGSGVSAQAANGMNPGETVADAAVRENNAMTPIKDVHFTKEGSAVLAQAVAASIAAQLPQPGVPVKP